MRRWREAAGVRRSHSKLAGIGSAELPQPWKKPGLFPNRLQLFPGDQKDVFHRALPENTALSAAHRGLLNDTKSFLQEPREFYWEPRRTSLLSCLPSALSPRGTMQGIDTIVYDGFGPWEEKRHWTGKFWK